MCIYIYIDLCCWKTALLSGFITETNLPYDIVLKSKRDYYPILFFIMLVGVNRSWINVFH